MFYFYKVSQYNQFLEQDMKSISITKLLNNSFLSISNELSDINLLDKIKGLHNHISLIIEENSLPLSYLNNKFDFTFNRELSRYYFSIIDDKDNKIIVSNYQILCLNEFCVGRYE